MMGDEAIKELAAAMNRLAAAIESVRSHGLVSGIQVNHAHSHSHVGGAAGVPSYYLQSQVPASGGYYSGSRG